MDDGLSEGVCEGKGISMAMERGIVAGCGRGEEIWLRQGGPGDPLQLPQKQQQTGRKGGWGGGREDREQQHGRKGQMKGNEKVRETDEEMEGFGMSLCARPLQRRQRMDEEREGGAEWGEKRAVREDIRR